MPAYLVPMPVSDEPWTPGEIAQKIYREGGIWDAYHWGVFLKRTGNPEIDHLLSRLEDDLSAAESTWGQLQELLPEPWEVDKADE